MTYTLQGQKGYVMDVGSAQDFWNLIEAVEKFSNKGPLVDFINTGKTVDTIGVIKAIQKILPDVPEPVKTMLADLMLGLGEAGSFGVVTQ